MKWSSASHFLALLVLMPCAALCDASPASPGPASLQTRDVTLRPVEVASAYSSECLAKVLPPYPHPSGTIFVGAFTTLNGRTGGRIGAGTLICPAYQGLVRFDLSNVESDSIANATLFYEAKQNYNLDGTVSYNRATCVGGIGATTQAWSSNQKAITPTLPELDHFQPPRGNFISPPVDITAFLKAHFAEIQANGIVLDGTVENLAIHYCYAVIGRIELRLDLARAVP